MHEDSARALYEFTKSYVPARGVKAVHDVALALVGQPPDKIDEGIATMARLFAENCAAEPDPPSETFVRGLIVVVDAMIRERIVELQGNGTGQS